MTGRTPKFAIKNILLVIIITIMTLNSISSNGIYKEDTTEISENLRMYTDEVANSDYYIKSFNSNVSDISIGFTLNQSVDDDIFSFNVTMDSLEQYDGISLPGYSGSYDSNAVLNLVSNFTGEFSQINNYSMSIELDQKYRNITSSLWYVSSDSWVQIDTELSQITSGQILIEFESGPIFSTGQIVLMGFELTTMETPEAFPIYPSLIWNNQASGNISLSINWNYEGTYVMGIDRVNIDVQKYHKNPLGGGYNEAGLSMMVLDSGDLSVTTFEISSFDTDDAQYIVIISVCNGAGCNPITASLTFFLENQTVNEIEDSANHSGVCPESHPYPSDPEGQGDNSSTTNYCCVDPYDEELNECYPTYDEIPCPSDGPCGQYKSPETLCEEWEYWNPDLIDTNLSGNGCPYYSDGNNTEDENNQNNNSTSDVDESSSDDIEIEVDMGDREIYLSAEETRSVSADEGWPSVTVTFYNLSSDSAYNRIYRMMDYSVSPPVEMFCNNWPSVLTSGPCSFNSTFTVTSGLDRQAFRTSYPALEDSTNACMEVTLENLDTGEVRTKMSCWTQKSLSDWDYDGVKDILDICGDTENGAIVDDQGCVIEAENTDAINDSTSDSIPGFEASVLLSSIVCALITLRRRV